MKTNKDKIEKRDDILLEQNSAINKDIKMDDIVNYLVFNDKKVFLDEDFNIFSNNFDIPIQDLKYYVNFFQNDIKNALENKVQEIKMSIAKKIYLNESMIIFSKDIDELSEQFNCTKTDIRSFYTNPKNKDTRKVSNKAVLGFLDMAKNLLKEEIKENNKKDIHEFDMKFGKTKNLSNETLLALQEKLNEEKMYFIELLEEEKERDPKRNNYKEYLVSVINEIKRLRKLINYIINQKISISV